MMKPGTNRDRREQEDRKRRCQIAFSRSTPRTSVPGSFRQSARHGSNRRVDEADGPTFQSMIAAGVARPTARRPRPGLQFSTRDSRLFSRLTGQNPPLAGGAVPTEVLLWRHS